MQLTVSVLYLFPTALFQYGGTYVEIGWSVIGFVLLLPLGVAARAARTDAAAGAGCRGVHLRLSAV